MLTKKHLLLFLTPLLTLVGVFLLFTKTAVVHAQTTDITPPVTVLTQTPSQPNGKNDWFVTPVQFNLNASDLESGVKEIRYRLNDDPWQSFSFSNTENMVLNPSFEEPGDTTAGVLYWEATVIDPEATYTQDPTSSPAFPTNSALISATGGMWHGINNKDNFVATTPYDNMTASVWLKTQDVSGGASFKVYAVSPNAQGGYTYTQLNQSSALLDTNDWTKISSSFTVTVGNAIGVYIDIGLVGPGQLWIDAVNINSSINNTQAHVTVATDNVLHTLEYYAIDNAENIEFSSCTPPITNCVTFKLDQTPPSNWRESGAYRTTGPAGSAHHLFVHVTVDDLTSGLSTLTNIYQYMTDKFPGSFGRFSNVGACQSTWQPSTAAPLGKGVTSNGAGTALLETQLTDFCNNDWKTCKTVRFYSEDMAGNTLTKEFCINGPWIRIRGGGGVRSNKYIDMISEPEGFSTDAIIEVREHLVEFFTSSKNWIMRSSPPPIHTEYEKFSNMINNKASMSSTASLTTTTGAHIIDGNYDLTSARKPSNLATAVFDKVILVDGNLRISTNVDISDHSTLLFIVSGNVEVAKTVTLVDAAIIADGTLFTAYNAGATEATNTLTLRGAYSANKFELQRTLQGTNNDHTPSEIFTYEPKYVLHTKKFLNNSSVTWL